MQRNWSQDLEAAPIGWLLYISVAPHEMPDGVSAEELRGFRLEDGWYALDAGWKRVRVASVACWATIEGEPQRGPAVM